MNLLHRFLTRAIHRQCYRGISSYISLHAFGLNLYTRTVSPLPGTPESPHPSTNEEKKTGLLKDSSQEKRTAPLMHFSDEKKTGLLMDSYEEEICDFSQRTDFLRETEILSMNQKSFDSFHGDHNLVDDDDPGDDREDGHERGRAQRPSPGPMFPRAFL